MKRIFIKNMVCDRCIMTVKTIFNELNIDFKEVKLGEVVIKKDIEPKKMELLDQKLQKVGFELIKNRNDKIVEKVRTEIINLIYKKSELLDKIVLSDYLAEKIGKDYSALSKLFSKNTGLTIEKYFILQKIERVKELISYDELTISEIAYMLGYSSSQHLSNQFKKIMHITPSEYRKKLKGKKRKKINEV